MPSSSATFLPRLGITTGDPAGIGPEVSLRAAQTLETQQICRLVLFGDAEILQSQSTVFGIPFDFKILTREELRGGSPLPDRALVDVPAERSEIEFGKGSKASGDAAARNVIECARACGEGLLHGIVTAPLNKRYLREAGYSYPGHTEFLAHLAGASSVAMAFLSERLKIVLVTVHLPLRLAISLISAGTVAEKVSITVREFTRLGLSCQRIAVAGMNPHAGESGLLGSEEIEHIEPAIREARKRHPGILIEGPVPADTVFYRAAQGEYDVVVSMFHDQGLTPIKLLGFGEAVNLTLGLPFIRTSVDHGTAFDIAGKGIARPDSMISAIRWAARLAASS